MLHNIRSSHNVGSIFRTADAAGVLHVYLTGYTPTPRDRFGRERQDIAKTALGAEKSVSWSWHKSATNLIAHLKKDGYVIVGVEQDPHAHDYTHYTAPGKSVFVFGNEVRGLSRAMRGACDTIIEIPQRGTKESLNVSVAAGIVLFHTTTKKS
jgi:tRNA G18 (ribose-2'-O)-methylase SpoU